MHGDALRYDEDVSFCLNGRVIRATRTYFYRQSQATIAATFADGRPFFSATLEPNGTATAVHVCGDDVYTGSLILRESDRWQTRWDISGAKSHTIATNYMRTSCPQSDV